MELDQNPRADTDSAAAPRKRGRELRTAESLRRALANRYRAIENDESISNAEKAKLLVAIASELRKAIKQATEESGIREWMELHEGCLQGRCAASRRAS